MTLSHYSWNPALARLASSGCIAPSTPPPYQVGLQVGARPTLIGQQPEGGAVVLTDGKELSTPAESRHREGMTEYKIIHDGLKGYGVVVSSPQRFLSVRGFVTELDAASWIAEQQASESALVAAVDALRPDRARRGSARRSAPLSQIRSKAT